MVEEWKAAIRWFLQTAPCAVRWMVEGEPKIKLLTSARKK
jgi:hypothetical protein